MKPQKYKNVFMFQQNNVENQNISGGEEHYRFTEPQTVYFPDAFSQRYNPVFVFYMECQQQQRIYRSIGK